MDRVVTAQEREVPPPSPREGVFVRRGRENFFKREICEGNSSGEKRGGNLGISEAYLRLIAFRK